MLNLSLSLGPQYQFLTQLSMIWWNFFVEDCPRLRPKFICLKLSNRNIVIKFHCVTRLFCGTWFQGFFPSEISSLTRFHRSLILGDKPKVESVKKTQVQGLGDGIVGSWSKFYPRYSIWSPEYLGVIPHHSWARSIPWALLGVLHPQKRPRSFPETFLSMPQFIS